MGVRSDDYELMDFIMDVENMIPQLGCKIENVDRDSIEELYFKDFSVAQAANKLAINKVIKHGKREK